MELIDYIKSGICIIIVLFLVFQYLRRNSSAIELLFIAFALRYFSIPLIGPTIDVLYLFSLVIVALEFISFLSGKIKLSRSKLMLFALPFLLFLFFLAVYIVQKNHYLGNLNPIVWYFKTSANYIKVFLPYFMVAIVIKRYADQVNTHDVYKTVYKIANYSSLLALVQLVFFVIFYNYGFLLQLIGLTGGYNYEYSVGFVNLVRIQAFFYEPKSLAAFLGLAVPVAIHLKNKKRAILFVLVGFLTLSQTFIVILLAGFIAFVVLKKIQNVRASILWSIAIIIGLFFSVSSLKDYLLENYATKEETIAYTIFLDRALNRYSLDDPDENRELFGIPLQPDIELPAVNFLRDNKIFLLTGFGSGNYYTLPFNYFIIQWNIDAIEAGTFKGHFDMGWIYLIAEFGFVFFLIIFFTMTKIKSRGFDGKFYSFLWLVFFFHRIDILLIAFFCLLFYKTSTRESFDSNYILQPG